MEERKRLRIEMQDEYGGKICWIETNDFLTIANDCLKNLEFFRRRNVQHDICPEMDFEIIMREKRVDKQGSIDKESK